VRYGVGHREGLQGQRRAKTGGLWGEVPREVDGNFDWLRGGCVQYWGRDLGSERGWGQGGGDGSWGGRADVDSLRNGMRRGWRGGRRWGEAAGEDVPGGGLGVERS